MEKKKNIIIVVLVISIILILLLGSCTINRLGKIGLVPTGNVDIFNIECDKQECDCNQDSAQVGNFDNLDDFYVNDNNIVWNSTNKLRIFSNPSYEFKNVIAPGSTNVYQFVVNNNQNFSINYNLNFIETNNYNINMMYRLKRNGIYVLGNNDTWVSIKDKGVNDIVLQAKTHDNYSLEWKWIDNNNDTEIGILDDANYSLEINIIASIQ